MNKDLIKEIKITDIENIKIGNAENEKAGTGCTVIICENGAISVIFISLIKSLFII